MERDETESTETRSGSIAIQFESVLLTSLEAAALCGMSRAAWYKRMASGHVPRPVKIGGATRWRKDELLRWIEAGCPPRAKWETVGIGQETRVMMKRAKIGE